MKSKRVVCGRWLLVNWANRSCISILSETGGLRWSNLDGDRNNGKHYFYNVKCMQVRIHQLVTLSNREIRLLTRTRRQSVRRCDIYVLRGCPTLTMFVDDFVAKFIWQKLVQLGPISVKLHLSITNNAKSNFPSQRHP